MSGGGLSVLGGSGCRISGCQKVGSLPATECNCFKRVSSSLFLHHLVLAGTNSKSSGTLSFARQELQGLGFSKQSGLELLVTDVVLALSQKVDTVLRGCSLPQSKEARVGSRRKSATFPLLRKVTGFCPRCHS